MLKKSLLTLLSLPLFAFGVTLVKDGTPASEIVLGSTPTRTAQFGAFELQHCIKLMTGAELPIVASASGNGAEIHIGNETPDKRSFKNEEYAIAFDGNKIYLAGNDNPDYGKVNYASPATFPPVNYYYRASLFAVYDFLEKACGMRFYSFGDDGIAFQPSATLDVAPFACARKPVMDAMRTPHFEGPSSHVNARDKALLLQRWRTAEIFGQVNHNIYSIYYRYWAKSPVKPYDSLFIEARPDYFAKREKNRTSSHIAKKYYKGDYVPSQLCYSSNGPIRYFAEEANRVYNGEEVLGARFGKIKRLPHTPFYYPIQPDDDSSVCQCPDCLATMEKEPKNYHFAWINRLAEEGLKINPDMKFATLAYSFASERPTTIDIHPSVGIQMCMSIQSWFQPLVYKRQHDTYKDWVEHEGKRRLLTTWLYLLNPGACAINVYRYKTAFPVLYPEHTGEYMTEFIKDGIRGYFAEIFLKHYELEAYVLNRLSYDDSIGYKDIIAEYFRLYYGKAGKTMSEIYSAMEEIGFNPQNYPEASMARDPKKSYIVNGYSEKDIWTVGSPERIARIGKMVAKAQEEANADSPVVARRLQRFIDCIWKDAVEGRATYDLHQKQRAIKAPSVTLPKANAEYNGDVTKVDFSRIEPFTNWRGVFNENLDSHKAVLKMVRDSKYVYMDYTEEDPEAIQYQKEPFWRNGLEIFCQEKSGPDYRQLFLSTNKQLAFYQNEIINGVARFEEIKTIPKNFVSECTNTTWHGQLAIPMDYIRIDNSSKQFTMNVIRTKLYTDGKGVSLYISPVFSGEHRDTLSRMATILLK